jgi:GTP pyrophosphokinase
MSKRDSQPAVEVDLREMMAAVVRKVTGYNPHADLDQIWRAYRLAHAAHAGQFRRSGHPYFVHALEVADILAGLRLDVDTLVASLLHDVVEDTQINLKEIALEFGTEVASMVDGVTKIGELPSSSPDTRRAENYRKLILSIAQDPRTVLIKLADRLHNMRTVEYLPEKNQQELANETLDVYAPLAHRFGIAKIKWELEDSSFKVLQPEKYSEIEKGINQSRAERERLIEELRVPLADSLHQAQIEATITGRPKHFYSIYRKMMTKGLSLSNLYDLLALRVIVGDKAKCYHVLGIIHALFPPRMDLIKDYIARPKPNMYQSLHTTVQVPTSKYVEFQIRTQGMHERSEIGIAAHWRYKEGRPDETDFSSMVRWLRQIMEWQEDVTDPREFMESLKIDFFRDEVFVFSPQGDLFQLPRGATPLDFAFRIHSEVGLHCVGAKVNGRIVSLRTPLENRDTVSILTSKNSRPSTSWLEIVKTSRAKHHIRRWIKSTQLQESIKLGREILEREFGRRKLKLNIERDLADLAQEMGYSDLDKLLAAVGSGDIPYQKVVNKVEPPPVSPASKVVSVGKDIYDHMLRRDVGGVRVAGVDNLMVSYAGCCQPIPGDEIIGIITRGRGVSVHRLGCPNLADPQFGERKIEVTWDSRPDQTFLVKLIVTAADRKNLLADVGQVISGERTNIHSGEFSTEGDLARATFYLEVRNLNNLRRILKAIARVPGVQSVERFQLS